MKGITFVITAGISFLLLILFTPYTGRAQNGSMVKGKVMLAAQKTQLRFDGGRYGRPSQSSGSSQMREDSVLVWLVGRDAVTESPPEEPVVLDQKNQQFNPVLLPVRQHGSVRIRNSDPVYHNVFSLSKTKKFNVGRRPKNQYMDVTFDKAGKVDVFCDIHSNMHAVIYVMPPEAVVWTKIKNGETFRLENVPPGKYKLKVVSLGFEEYSVPVKATRNDTINVETITLNS